MTHTHTQLAEIGAAGRTKCNSELSIGSSIVDLFSGDSAAELQRSGLASDLLLRRVERALALKWRQVLADMYSVAKCDVVIGGQKVLVCGSLLSDCHVSAKDEWEVEM